MASRFSNTSSSLETVRFLLDNGADVNPQDDKGWTPLMNSARNSNGDSSLETVRLLLERGANPNIKNHVKIHALFMSAWNSNGDSSIDTVKLLIEKGANVNLTAAKDWTSLMIATKHSNGISSLETVKILLDKGADPNMKSDDGLTALMVATGNSNTTSSLETVILLLERGADPFVNLQCPTEECTAIIDEARWVRLSARDKQLAEKYNRDIPISKDVWLIIMRHKRQQQLCSDLSSERNKELLKYFALELEIPLAEIRDLTKGQLCGIISRQLTYKQFDRIKTERRSDKLKIIEVASRYGIDTTRPFNEIMNDLAKIF